MGDIRYRRFVERLAQADDRAAAILASRDEDLVQALAGVSTDPPDPYLANVLASELLNRTRRKNAILDAASEGMLALDHDGTIVLANPAVERILGWPPAELHGRSIDETLHPHERPSESPCDLLQKGEGLHDAAFRAKAGDVVPVTISLAHVVRDGRVEGFVVLFRDATERKLAERRRAARLAITETIAHARSVEDAAPGLLRAIGDGFGWDAGAFWIDAPDGNLRCIAFWAREGIDLPHFAAVTKDATLSLGQGVPGIVWQTGEPLVVPDVSSFDPKAFPRLQAATRDGLRSALAFPCPVERKPRAVAEFYTVRHRPPDEHLLAAVESVGSDVGQFIERRRAEAKLRESEMRKAGILEAALDAVVTIDADSRVLEFNSAAERIFGWTREEIKGLNLYSTIVPHRFREAHQRGIRHYKATGEGPILGRLLELPALRKDGTEFTAELYIVPVPLPGGTLFTSYVRDVTGRKKDEAPRGHEQDRRA